MDEPNCFIDSVVVIPGVLFGKPVRDGEDRESMRDLASVTVVLTMTGDPTEAIRTGNFRATGIPDWKFLP